MKSIPGNGVDDEAEWQRVMLNPDNMIVSDSLRDQVTSILSNRSESSDYFVSFSIGNRALILELTRLDRGKDKIVISGTCDRITLKPFLASDLTTWTSANIVCGEDSIVEISLIDRQLEVSHEISSAADTCFVTLTCIMSAQKSAKRVL